MTDLPTSSSSDAGFPHREPHYENEEGTALLVQLAARRGGLTRTALLRLLTREEAQRTGLVAVMSRESHCAIFEQERRDADLTRGGR